MTQHLPQMTKQFENNKIMIEFHANQIKEMGRQHHKEIEDSK